MKYDVTYSCGHDGKVELFGKRENREWRLKYLQEQECPECHAKEILELGKKAQHDNVEAGLVPLSGTPKQVAWAEQIRHGFYIMADGVFEKAAGDEAKNIALFTRDEFLKNTSASYWIDRRIMLENDFYAALNTNYKNRHEIDVASSVDLERSEVETFRPIEVISEVAVSICNTDEMVKVKSEEKIECLRVLMRRRKFEFVSGYWQKHISVMDGNADNYAAFIANEILSIGLLIRIKSDSALEIFKAKKFTPPSTKMISQRDNSFCIWFDREFGDYYQAIRSIPGAKWQSGRGIIRREHWESVVDFAEANGFCFSPGAEELVKKMKRERESQIEVVPEEFHIDEKVIAPSVPEVLDIPDVTVCDELMDRE